jgi:hypothetical protein
MIDAIEHDREPICSGSGGVAALEMALGAYESQFTGRRVEFPLSNRKHPLQGLDSVSFGNNYRNQVITGILRIVLWKSPTFHPKWGTAPGTSVKTDKCPSMLGK